MLNTVTLLLLTLLTTKRCLVIAQDYTDECPTQFGFFADAVQCDRYYECKDGEVSNQLHGKQSNSFEYLI